jgi:hypothetical protein
MNQTPIQTNQTAYQKMDQTACQEVPVYFSDSKVKDGLDNWPGHKTESSPEDGQLTSKLIRQQTRRCISQLARIQDRKQTRRWPVDQIN